MTPQRVFLFIFFVYLTGFFAHALFIQKTVYGDGVYYYSWLRSAVVDHDVNFHNEYDALGGIKRTAPGGMLGNIYSVGPALLWSPAFLLVHGLLHGDGYSLPYQLSVGITSVFLTIIGLFLLYRLLTQFFSEPISLLVTLTITFTTNLWFYGSIDAANSHGVSFFTSALLFTLLFQKKKQYFFLGATVGLLALIRIQDAAFGLLLLPFLNKKSIVPIATGFFLMFLPQMFAWQALYHKFWVSPYLELPGYGFNFKEPHILDVLFSIRNGLIVWTPVIGLSFVGLCFTSVVGKLHKYFFIALVVIQIFLVSSWTTWWQGASYSGRMFVSLLPIFALGLGTIYAWLKKYRWTVPYYVLCIIAPLSIINFLLMVFFLLHKQSL